MVTALEASASAIDHPQDELSVPTECRYEVNNFLGICKRKVVEILEAQKDPLLEDARLRNLLDVYVHRAAIVLYNEHKTSMKDVWLLAESFQSFSVFLDAVVDEKDGSGI